MLTILHQFQLTCSESIHGLNSRKRKHRGRNVWSVSRQFNSLQACLPINLAPNSRTSINV